MSGIGETSVSLLFDASRIPQATTTTRLESSVSNRLSLLPSPIRLVSSK